MGTVNNSYSIPNAEFEKVKEKLIAGKKVISDLNMTEIVRVAFYNLVNEKDVKDISVILDVIGRKKPGRPKKDKIQNADTKNSEIDFSQISSSQWKKIKSLFEEDEEALLFISEILFDLQNSWKRNVGKTTTTSKSTRWRRLKKWQEDGRWSEVYRRLAPTFDKQHQVKWNEIFLKSFLTRSKKN